MNCPTECNHVSGYTAPLTRQKAIEAKCKDCSYDPLDDGTWRQQVERCELTDCALWNYRPKSRSKKPSLPDSASVEAHYQTNNDQVMQEEPHGKHIEF